MHTKIKFLKKLVVISSHLIFFIFSNKSYSQIIYTDITDATPNATYPLDLNNDTIIDFLIQFNQANKVMCKPQNNNTYSGDFVGGVHSPWALPSTISICDSLLTWYDSINPGTMASGTSAGHWVGATNKYLALKLIVGANTYYGWARFDVLATSSSFTIKDYAYQSTPNACIKSGQMALGMDRNTTENILSVIPNPFNSSATLQTISNLKNATLTICNSYGQTVMQVKNISGQTVPISRDRLPSGIYFIRLEEADKIIAIEKLIIID